MDAPRLNVIRFYTPHPNTEVPLLPIPPKVPNYGVAWGMTAPEVRRPPPVDNLNYPAHLGRDRFESTVPAGTLCQSDRFASTYSRRPYTVYREGRRKTVAVCV